MIHIGNRIMELKDINHQASTICIALIGSGYEAYIVGGCVRDLIIGRVPKDWDICTNASPDQVTKVFDKEYIIVPTGLKHGTVTLIENNTNEAFEVTTYRIDGQYSDGRHPDEVKFTSSLKEDLARRDFTMNAIALGFNKDMTLHIQDPFNGCIDIERKVIRCVGVPKERFKEDALRMVRAIRFSCQLDFTIEQETFKAIQECNKGLADVSLERRCNELIKIIESSSPTYGIMQLYESTLLRFIVPELYACIGCKQSEPWHLYDVFDHTMEALRVITNITSDLETRLAVLYHDVGKPEVKTIDINGIHHFYRHPVNSHDLAVNSMQVLRFDRKTIENVASLVLNHDYEFVPTKPSVKRFISHLKSHDLFPKIIQLRIADIMAQHPMSIGTRLEDTNKCLSIYNKIIEDSEVISLKDLAINGDDLLLYGYKGPEIGTVLHQLLDLVKDEKIQNDRDIMLLYIQLKKGIIECQI